MNKEGYCMVRALGNFPELNEDQKNNFIAVKAIGVYQIKIMDFLRLTTTKEFLEDLLSKKHTSSSRDIGWLSFKASSGKVTGHEGRHRAANMYQDGKRELLIGLYPEPRHRQWDEDLSEMPKTLLGQFDTTVHVPLDKSKIEIFYQNISGYDPNSGERQPEDVARQDREYGKIPLTAKHKEQPMRFFSTVKQKYQIVADSLGFMNRKELAEKLPELAKAYDGVYKGKKPDIKIVASEKFSFPIEQYSQGSWHVIFAALNGEVKSVDVSKRYGQTQELLPNSMILDCLTGHLNICYLYVHPKDATPLIKEAEDLSDDEYRALAVMQGLKPFAREEEFYRSKYGSRDYYDARRDKPDEYKAALKSLAAKGLVKINAAGSAQLTLEGKNRALQAGKKIKNL